jgi:hypothetical protein
VYNAHQVPIESTIEIKNIKNKDKAAFVTEIAFV